MRLSIVFGVLVLLAASEVPRADRLGTALSVIGVLLAAAVAVKLMLRISANHRAKLERDEALRMSRTRGSAEVPTRHNPQPAALAVGSEAQSGQSPTSPVRVLAAAPSPAYRLPAATDAIVRPKREWQARWIGAAEAVRIEGRDVRLNFTYVGEVPLRGPYDPAPGWIIDPRLPVDWNSGPHPGVDEWRAPVYVDMTPARRGAYLRWMHDARSDHSIPAGYGMLFLAGIEVRLTCGREAVSTAEARALLAEVWRLRASRPEHNYTFASTTERLATIILALHPSVEPLAIDMFRPRWGYPEQLPEGLAVLVGREIGQRRALSAALALEWLRAQRPTVFRTASQRCAREFETYFAHLYRQRYPDGLLVSPPKSRLRLTYIDHADDGRECPLPAEVPDPGRLVAPLERLAELAEEAHQGLDAYSRYRGRSDSAATEGTLEGSLLLPEAIRPAALRTWLESLRLRVGQGMVVLHVPELLAALGAAANEAFTTRTQWERLTEAMAGVGLAIEWAGKGPPSAAAVADDRLAVFALDPASAAAPATSADGSRPSFEEASIALDLAMLVMQSDASSGSAGELASETRVLTGLGRAVTLLDGVSPNDRRRLIARLRLRYTRSVTLASLKRPLAALPAGAASRLCNFLVRAAQQDGVVSPAEVRALQKVFRALGKAPEDVYHILHNVDQPQKQVTPAAPSTPSPRVSVITLDPIKLAALEAETHVVQSMLAGIFTDEPLPPPTTPAGDGPEAPATSTIGTHTIADQGAVETVLPGLDDAHAALARLLLTAPSHARAVLLDAAAEHSLMLDGALETINDVAYDHWETPFCEGEDPVVLTPEALALAGKASFARRPSVSTDSGFAP